MLIPGCRQGPFNWSKPQSSCVRKVTFTLTMGTHSPVLPRCGSPRGTSQQKLRLAWISLEFLPFQFQTQKQRNDFKKKNLDCCLSLVLSSERKNWKSLLKRNIYLFFPPLKLRLELFWTWLRTKKIRVGDGAAMRILRFLASRWHLEDMKSATC